MKKLFIITMALIMTMSICSVSFAETDNETVLSTTVPDASYTLNIPEDQSITFGTTSADIGNVTITDSSGFAKGKNLSVKIEYEPFASEDVNTTIPYKLSFSDDNYSTYDVTSGDSIVFQGLEKGSCAEKFAFTSGGGLRAAESLLVISESADWGKALGGDYASTISYTATVVAESN